MTLLSRVVGIASNGSTSPRPHVVGVSHSQINRLASQPYLLFTNKSSDHIEGTQKGCVHAEFIVVVVCRATMQFLVTPVWRSGDIVR